MTDQNSLLELERHLMEQETTRKINEEARIENENRRNSSFEEQITQAVLESSVKYHDPIEWDADTNYKRSYIVSKDGRSYLSKKDVPAGTPVDNADYWQLVNDGNAEVEKLAKKSEFVTPEQFGAAGDGITDDTQAIQNAINSEKKVIFCSKIYKIYAPIILPDTANNIDLGGAEIVSENTTVFTTSGAWQGGVLENGDIKIITPSANANGIDGCFYQCVFNNLRITNTYDGIVIKSVAGRGNPVGNKVSKVAIKNCNNIGIKFYSSPDVDAAVTDGWVTDCSIDSNNIAIYANKCYGFFFTNIHTFGLTQEIFSLEKIAGTFIANIYAENVLKNFLRGTIVKNLYIHNVYANVTENTSFVFTSASKNSTVQCFLTCVYLSSDTQVSNYTVLDGDGTLSYWFVEGISTNNVTYELNKKGRKVLYNSFNPDYFGNFTATNQGIVRQKQQKRITGGGSSAEFDFPIEITNNISDFVTVKVYTANQRIQVSNWAYSERKYSLISNGTTTSFVLIDEVKKGSFEMADMNIAFENNVISISWTPIGSSYGGFAEIEY